MENANYEEKDLRAYHAWLKYIIHDETPQYTNCNVLPQYANCNMLPQSAYCREPTKYYGASVRSDHKDLLFRLLMQDKENLLSVYNALNGTDYRNVDELRIVTLEDAVYMKYKNDVSFLFQSYLTLYEHQSTFNPNMPLRNLFYVTAQLGNEYYNRRIYSRRQVKIPTPKFVVFYNGTEKRPDNEILKLSDAFECYEAEPELELKVRVININKGHNEEIMKTCRILREYGEFIDCIRKHRKDHRTEEAVVMAVDECIRENILKDLLTKQKAEVIETMLFDYDEEEVLSFLKQEEYEIGKEEGKAEGIMDTLVKSIIELLGMKGTVSKELRERICGESNPEILRKWLLETAVSDSIEAFEESLIAIK